MAKRLAEAIIRFANSLKTQYNDLSMFSKVFTCDKTDLT